MFCFVVTMTQVQKNLMLNILNLVCNVVVGLYYTPYLVRSLGVVAYGIVPLALIVNQFIVVVTGALTSALTRFYSIELQKKEYERASRSLSTSLILIGGFVVILLPFVILFVANIGDVFNIPGALIRDAKLLFGFTLSSFFVSLLSSVFNITSYANNRLDVLNVLKIERILLKFVFVVFLFEVLGKKVWCIGLANFMAEFVVLFHSMKLHYKISRSLVKIRWSLFSKTALFAIGGMAIWTIVHQLGDIFIYRMDNVVVNKFWGTSVSGALGAITELGAYVSTAVTVLASLFGPMILIAYSQGKHDQVQRLTLSNSMIIGALSAVACGLLVGFSSEFLFCWLGDSFVVYRNWLVLKLLPLPFFLASGIVAFSNRAWNMVKYPAIATIVFGVLNVLIMNVVACKCVNDSMNAVLLILATSLIVNLMQSYLLNFYFFLRIYPGCKKQFVLITIKIVTILLLSICFSILVSRMYTPKNLFELVCVLMIQYFFLSGVFFLSVFSRSEMESLLSLFINRK